MILIITSFFLILLREIKTLTSSMIFMPFVLVFTFNSSLSHGQATSLAQAKKEWVDKKIASMTIEEKVGQMFVLGFKGTEMSPYLKTIINELKPGSFIIFKRNVKTIHKIFSLNRKIQETSYKQIGLPIFLMVDQEGGAVTRIKTTPNSPSALALGTTNDATLARKTGYVIGQILSLLGFNVNLAPVMDLSNPFKNSFIGNRSFGQNPDKVKLFGKAFSSGLSDSGVIPTAKHYPGHG